MVRTLATVLSLMSIAGPALAQAPGFTAQPVPAAGAPAASDPWPWPPPDPKTWWDDKWPAPPEVSDPLGGRRLGRSEKPLAVDNGYDPLLYRLWALMPLQNQVLRSGEMVLEVAVRPSTSARQTLIRVTVRRDGKVFVQGRIGLGCCEAGIARRVGFDVEAPEGSAAKFLALREDPLWAAPREVRVVEEAGAADALCLEGASYDLTLATPGAVRSVRRACDNAAVGQAAAVLETVFAAALGHEPRFDVVYPTGADFSGAKAEYARLTSGGGQLKAAPNSRPQAPTFTPPPEEPEAAAPN